MYKNKRYSQPRSLKKPIIIGLLVLLLLGGGMTALELTDTTHIFHAKKPSYNSPTAGPATKGIPEGGDTTGKTGQSSGNTSGTDNTDDDKHPTSPAPSDEPLIEPNGNFVNTHTVSGNEQMESICNTSPGASCQITFTNGTTTKSLIKQTADRGGATYWAWHIKDSSINLTPGTWKITATATLGSQTKSLTDATSLEVSP
jgi:hypothetical protein